jgi:hypothetical protein
VADLLEAFWGVSYVNSLPLDVALDLVALDENGSQLFTKSISVAGSEGQTKVDLDATDIQKLTQLNRLVWSVRFDSSGVSGLVLNADDGMILDLSLGGRIKLEVL